jgi:hypothetical protein
MSLLLGLNGGWYWGDYEEMTADMVKQDGRLHKSRAKNKRDGEPSNFVGGWLLWEETKELLKYGLKRWKLEDEYTAFARQHGLPPHIALRKTVTQFIHDNVGEKHARLWRCEQKSDNHNSSYICHFTPLQLKMVDKGIKAFGKRFGIQ